MHRDPHFVHSDVKEQLQLMQVALQIAVERVEEMLDRMEYQTDGPGTLVEACKDISTALTEVDGYREQMGHDIEDVFDLNDELMSNQQLAEDAYQRGRQDRLKEILSYLTPENRLLLLRVMRLKQRQSDIKAQPVMEDKPSKQPE